MGDGEGPSVVGHTARPTSVPLWRNRGYTTVCLTTCSFCAVKCFQISKKIECRSRWACRVMKCWKCGNLQWQCARRCDHFLLRAMPLCTQHTLAVCVYPTQTRHAPQPPQPQPWPAVQGFTHLPTLQLCVVQIAFPPPKGAPPKKAQTGSESQVSIVSFNVGRVP